MHQTPAEQKSLSNALRAIRKDRAFPQNVLADAWDDYFFFEADRMFDASFIKAKDAIMDSDGSISICMVNLGHGGSTVDDVAKPLFLDRVTGSAEYISRLRGDGAPLNWLFLMDRYVCASDVGGWCFYCEKENDVAVFAVRDRTAVLPASGVVADILKATSVRTLGTTEATGHFSFRKLIPQWRDRLASDYQLPSFSVRNPAA